MDEMSHLFKLATEGTAMKPPGNKANRTVSDALQFYVHMISPVG